MKRSAPRRETRREGALKVHHPASTHHIRGRGRPPPPEGLPEKKEAERRMRKWKERNEIGGREGSDPGGEEEERER
jgi:hypothetical protein